MPSSCSISSPLLILSNPAPIFRRISGSAAGGITATARRAITHTCESARPGGNAWHPRRQVKCLAAGAAVFAWRLRGAADDGPESGPARHGKDLRPVPLRRAGLSRLRASAVGGKTAEQAATDNAVKSAAIGTAVGAVAGGLIGGHQAPRSARASVLPAARSLALEAGVCGRFAAAALRRRLHAMHVRQGPRSPGRAGLQRLRCNRDALGPAARSRRRRPARTAAGGSAAGLSTAVDTRDAKSRACTRAHCCSQRAPLLCTGPGILVLPGTGKTFDQFRFDDQGAAVYARRRQSSSAVSGSESALPRSCSAGKGAVTGRVLQCMYARRAVRYR